MPSAIASLRSALGPLQSEILPHLEGPAYEPRFGLTALSSAQDADLDYAAFLAPGVELFPYQRAGVRYGLEAGRAIIGYDMGLGKTLIAITVLAIRKAFPAVVTCPASLTLNWKREFAMFAPSIKVEILKGRTPGPLPQADVYIIGSSVVADWKDVIMELEPQALVIDECQQFKSKDAKRTVAMRQIAKWLPADAPVLLLSGTYVKNRPDEAIPQLQILNVLDAVFGGLWEFLGRYYPKIDRWERKAQNLDEMFRKMADSCYARLEFDDVRHQLGDKAPQGVMRVAVATEMGGKYAAEYIKARNDLRDFLLGHHADKAIDNGATMHEAERIAYDKTERAMKAEAIVQLGALRRLIGLAKMDSVKDHVNTLLEQGEQVIIFANHREIVKAYAEHFKAPTIMGGDKVDNVERAKAAFQAGEARVIVLNIEAGGTGHTLTASNNVVWAEFPWTPADMRQGEARADRIGQTKLVISHWMVGANGVSTIDERLVGILNDKSQVTTAMLNGKAEGLIDVDDVYTALMDWAKGE